MATPATVATDCHVFTPETLAVFWGQPWTAARIRELCRTRRIPAKKLGPKLWVIPAAALKAWTMEGLDGTTATPTPDGGAPHQQAYRVEVRR